MTISIHVRYRLLIVSVIAALSVVLSGCQGSAAPGGSSSLPSTTSPTSAASIPSPTQTPTAPPAYKPADASGKAQNVPVPEKPALADENSKAGLEAFTKYWFALLSYAFETGDITEWNRLTSPSCVFCVNLQETVEVGYKLDRWQVGGRMVTPSVSSDTFGVGPSQQVVVQVVQESTEFYKADGSVGREPSEATNSASVLIAEFDQGSWSVQDLHLLR